MLAAVNRDLAAVLQKSTDGYDAEGRELGERERQRGGGEDRCEMKGEMGRGVAGEGESGRGSENSSGVGCRTRKSVGEGRQGLLDENGGESRQGTQSRWRRESARGRGCSRGGTGEGMQGETNAPQNKDNTTVLKLSGAPPLDAGETGKALMELNELGQVCGT